MIRKLANDAWKIFIILALISSIATLFYTNSLHTGMTTTAVIDTTQETLLVEQYENYTTPQDQAEELIQNLTIILPQNETAQKCLENAKQQINDMKQTGFSTQYVEDLYDEAQQAFTGPNITKLEKQVQILNETGQSTDELLELIAVSKPQYNKTIQLCEQITLVKKEAIALSLEITQLEKLVNEQQQTVDITIPKQYIEQAQDALDKEHYADAKQYINQTTDALEQSIIEGSRTRVLLKVAKRSVTVFAKEHWQLLIILTAIILLISYVLGILAEIYHTERKIAHAKTELKATTEMLKSVQKEYFGQGQYSSGSYKTKKNYLKQRQLELKKDIPVMENNLKRYKKMLWVLTDKPEKRVTGHS